MKNNIFPIAKEGSTYIFSSAGLSLAAFILDMDIATFLFMLSTLFFVYLFRNPERELLSFERESVLSPADGRLVSIEELVDDEEYALRVEIESNYSDVSLLRAPINAEVNFIKSLKGTRVSKKSALFSTMNENSEIIFTDTNNNSLKVSHRLKQSFKNLEINLVTAQNLLQTARYGVMINGITTLYFPKNFRLSAHAGQSLKAGESLMGYFS